MNQRFKRIPFFVMLALAFSIPVFSAYICFCDLLEADSLSRGLRFESAEQEGLPAYHECRPRLLRTSFFSFILTLEGNDFRQFPFFLNPLASTTPTISILRC